VKRKRLRVLLKEKGASLEFKNYNDYNVEEGFLFIIYRDDEEHKSTWINCDLIDTVEVDER